jgi:hypothetical protein
MTHIDENKLLAYALEISESDTEKADIAAHVSTCAECRARLENIQKDIDIISGVQPMRRVLHLPSRPAQSNIMNTIIRSAALIIFGIFVGFGASKLIHHEPALVSPAYLTMSPPADSLTGYAITDATEIPARYYKNILDDRK